METITITFGDQAENHVRMQKIGIKQNKGYIYEELKEIKENFPKYICSILKLHKLCNNECPKAYLLIIKNGVNEFTNPDKLFKEIKNLDFDKKAYMYGRVVNKIARYNLCFDDKSQEPDYENKKGRIISFTETKYLNKIKKSLHKYFLNKSENLVADGNYYYDIDKCGIGYHGDSERKIVIGIRLGATLPLVYQWYYKNEIQSKKLKINLEHGDIYVMSDKAVGYEWKQKNKYTLRHAAGCNKFIKNE